MNNKKIIIGVMMICVSTLVMSCSSTKKSGCYYGDESIKEIPVETKEATKAYTIAD